MIKTFIAFGTYRFTKTGLRIIMSVGTNVDRSFVWNFEFGSLGFVCYLVFGTWNFMIFIKKLTFLNSVNYL